MRFPFILHYYYYFDVTFTSCPYAAEFHRQPVYREQTQCGLCLYWTSAETSGIFFNQNHYFFPRLLSVYVVGSRLRNTEHSHCWLINDDGDCGGRSSFMRFLEPRSRAMKEWHSVCRPWRQQHRRRDSLNG